MRIFSPVLCRGILARPVARRPHVRLDGALRGRVEALERRHDLAAREDLDAEASAAHLLDELTEALGRALQVVELGRPGRGHPPLDPGLGDDRGRVADDRDGGSGSGQEPAAMDHHPASSTRPIVPRTMEGRPGRSCQPLSGRR
jgi:hypothetical protein